MILIIDNYDSFTYNLVQYLGELGADVTVVRNDKITLAEIEKLAPEKIVISPGPGKPKDAGISVALIKALAKKVPILGVCLGHQAIGAAFGATVVEAKVPMHGKMSAITHDGKTIFKGIKSPFEATRYHSLVVPAQKLPRQLEISAQTEDGTVMGLRHKTYPVEGVQFHPESIMTVEGKKLLANFLKLPPAAKLQPGKARIVHLPAEEAKPARGEAKQTPSKAQQTHMKAQLAPPKAPLAPPKTPPAPTKLQPTPPKARSVPRKK